MSQVCKQYGVKMIKKKEKEKGGGEGGVMLYKE